MEPTARAEELGVKPEELERAQTMEAWDLEFAAGPHSIELCHGSEWLGTWMLLLDDAGEVFRAFPAHALQSARLLKTEELAMLLARRREAEEEKILARERAVAEMDAALKQREQERGAQP